MCTLYGLDSYLDSKNDAKRGRHGCYSGGRVVVRVVRLVWVGGLEWLCVV